MSGDLIMGSAESDDLLDHSLYAEIASLREILARYGVEGALIGNEATFSNHQLRALLRQVARMAYMAGAYEGNDGLDAYLARFDFAPKEPHDRTT